jgi:DNA relaxase NicK
MQFDWYQATLNAPKDDVFTAMEKAYPHTDLRPSKPSNGYTHGAELVRGDSVLLRSMWGGVNGDGTTHCVSSGSNSTPFATFARQHFTDHQVSRLDVAIDYHEADSFKRLSKLLITYARGKRVKTSTAGDWIKHQGGKTLYIGSRSSSAYLRLYEKGKQLGMDVNPHWTRCELEVKPGSKEGKAFLATATPEQCWGASKWSMEVNALLGNLDISRAPVGTVHTPSDDERALHYLVKQYGPLLQRIYHLCGDDWNLVGEYLGRRINPEEFDLIGTDGKDHQLALF